MSAAFQHYPVHIRAQLAERAKERQAEAEREREAAAQLKLYEPYRFEPDRYIQEKLVWQPWRGSPEHPGQQEILDAYVLALRQQHEREDFEGGRLVESELQYWQPGQVIKNRIRVEAGHTVGKTKLASGIVNHFFDCFAPCVGYCFAPGWEQIHDLLHGQARGSDGPAETGTD